MKTLWDLHNFASSSSNPSLLAIAHYTSCVVCGYIPLNLFHTISYLSAWSAIPPCILDFVHWISLRRLYGSCICGYLRASEWRTDVSCVDFSLSLSWNMDQYQTPSKPYLSSWIPSWCQCTITIPPPLQNATPSKLPTFDSTPWPNITHPTTKTKPNIETTWSVCTSLITALTRGGGVCSAISLLDWC